MDPLPDGKLGLTPSPPVVLEGLETEAKFALELQRLNFFHGRALIELLMISDRHYDEDPADEAGAEDESDAGDPSTTTG